MELTEILKQVNEIFKKELDNENIVLTFESSGEDVEMFWRLVAQYEISFERKDLLKKVLLQKRIKNSIEQI